MLCESYWVAIAPDGYLRFLQRHIHEIDNWSSRDRRSQHVIEPQRPRFSILFARRLLLHEDTSEERALTPQQAVINIYFSRGITSLTLLKNCIIFKIAVREHYITTNVREIPSVVFLEKLWSFRVFAAAFLHVDYMLQLSRRIFDDPSVNENRRTAPPFALISHTRRWNWQNFN